MKTWHGYPIFEDSTSIVEAVPKEFYRGLIPRDYSIQPANTFGDPPDEMNLIPDSEIESRIAEQESLGSSLEHLYMNSGMKHLDQNGYGYCWAFSVTHTVMLSRIVANLPYIPLSATAVASVIKGGRNEGGWCGQAAAFINEKGVPSQEHWPQYDNSLRYWDDDCKENAAKHKIEEDWLDMAKPAYERNLTWKQVQTCLLLNQPCSVDFNWWGHSVCAVRLVQIERGNIGLMILNSWKNWGKNGLGVITGSKRYPDGAMCTRVTTAVQE